MTLLAVVSVPHRHGVTIVHREHDLVSTLCPLPKTDTTPIRLHGIRVAEGSNVAKRVSRALTKLTEGDAVGLLSVLSVPPRDK